jgi:hypothetical protein
MVKNLSTTRPLYISARYTEAYRNHTAVRLDQELHPTIETRDIQYNWKSLARVLYTWNMNLILYRAALSDLCIISSKSRAIRAKRK